MKVNAMQTKKMKIKNEKQYIKIRGAREHNLKNIDLDIPRGELVVLTGLSGSGKSTLAFDTLYAEGQRRYVESLSSYARQFLGQMEKPDVDLIEGLSPAIAIDQKSTNNNPRSTVGTVTEIHDFLRLLYARVGDVHCPHCDRKLESLSLDQIIEQISQEKEGTRLYVCAPLVRERKGSFVRLAEDLQKQGYTRVIVDGQELELYDFPVLDKNVKHSISLIVDRFVWKESVRSRLADALEKALAMAEGLVSVRMEEKQEEESIRKEKLFSQKLSCPHCELSLGEISPRSFSFNNPLGACPDCTGLGFHRHFQKEKLIAQPKLSLKEGALQVPGFDYTKEDSWSSVFLQALAEKHKVDLSVPYEQLPPSFVEALWYGNGNEKLTVDTSKTKYDRGEDYVSRFEGILPTLDRRYRETSEEMRSYYEPYMSLHTCETCKGGRLKKELLSVYLSAPEGRKNIHEFSLLSILKEREFLQNFLEHCTEGKKQIAERIVQEILAKLGFLIDVGLDYMTLARSASTLSGGEAQRIRLATQIGSGLMGVLYILDEPSIGLHQRDNTRLIATLEKLRDMGNSILVVEHDEDTMYAADHIIDIGPKAGIHGGEVVAEGTVESIKKNPASITGQYLSGKKKIPLPLERRQGKGAFLEVHGAKENNLKNISVAFPQGVLSCITGVSGSGKSTLVNGILLPALEKAIQNSKREIGKHSHIVGAECFDKVIAIDQSPIGRTPRSNPVTYTGAFDLIRALFAETKMAKTKGFKQGRFSFNVKGGRCESCSGDGVNRIEMHFLPDLFVPCEVCKGKRYNRETLEVKFKEKNIAEVLEMTIEEASEFFADIPSIAKKLETLKEVGLGYISLGQSSTTLSGGEAQRVKLAYELSKRSTGKTIYILDEPTTGLHVADVHKLVEILQKLVDGGNTVLVIEHNLEVIKCADYLVDLGPEGGEGGGSVVATGTPEEVAQCPSSYTGKYLKTFLK